MEDGVSSFGIVSPPGPSARVAVKLWDSRKSRRTSVRSRSGVHVGPVSLWASPDDRLCICDILSWTSVLVVEMGLFAAAVTGAGLLRKRRWRHCSDGVDGEHRQPDQRATARGGHAVRGSDAGGEVAGLQLVEPDLWRRGRRHVLTKAFRAWTASSRCTAQPVHRLPAEATAWRSLAQAIAAVACARRRAQQHRWRSRVRHRSDRRPASPEERLARLAGSTCWCCVRASSSRPSCTRSV